MLRNKPERLSSDLLGGSRRLNTVEQQEYAIEHAISSFPYYADFYKQYVVFAQENRLSDKTVANFERYLIYSKMNPDHEFVNKFLK